MIYTYEAAVLKHINQVSPDIKLATYAKEQDMFNSLAQVIKVPALLFYRQSTDWSFAASFRVNDGSISGRFVPCTQTYIARIYVANAGDAISLANKIRFYIEDHPYVNMPYYCGDLDVALRLLYIKVDEDRNITDKKGPMRFVEFSWSSVLLLDDIDEQKWGLVEKVKIYLNEVGQVQIFSDDTLLKTIQ